MSVCWNEIVERTMPECPKLDLPRNFKLPCLPQSIVEFTSISNDPKAGPKQLAAPVESDSALTAAVLKQVNSSVVGLRQPAVSVAHAITLLGVRRTKTLILASALQAATTRVQSRLINNSRFQAENRMRAAFARRVAVEFGADAETANLAGMLQDFMIPLLSEAYRADYAVLLESQGNLVDEEERRFGWNHTTVGAGVMREWGFPDELVAAVLFHHDVDHVISDVTLRQSSVGAAVAAGALPESLGQSPSGFEALVKLQNEVPSFCFLSVALDVDQEIDPQGREEALSDRLGKLAQANLEQRRLDRIHQYRKLGSYTLQDQLGSGATGVIYRAQHDLLKRISAIKVLRSANVSSEALAQFQEEVQLTCQLTSPNTVSVYDYGVTAEGLFYYVMEFLEGVTLGHIVRASGPLPAGRVIHFLRQICGSLAEAHGLNLIHRDLKPENLMSCTRGGVPDTVKVLDFGLARICSAQPQADQTPVSICGTPHYMSPESITEPQNVDVRSDLYSLGAVGYFLLTGQTVFSGTKVSAVLQSHVSEIPTRPSIRLGSSIDADLEDVIMQCLSKSREDRPANADEFKLRLSRCKSAGSWNPFEAIQLGSTTFAPKSDPRMENTELCPEDTVIVCPTSSALDVTA